MSWISLRVPATAEQREALGAWLVAHTGQAIEEKDDGTLLAFAATPEDADRIERALRGERTLVICTHDLAEARELTERVAVLHRGRLVALGATEQVLGEGDPLALFRGEGRAA